MVFRPDTFTKNFGAIDLQKAEEIILKHKNEFPVTLVLPTTYEDAIKEPMDNILKIISDKKTNALFHRIIIGLDNADTEKKYNKILKKTQTLENKIVMWNDSPEMQKLYEKIGGGDLEIVSGKGRNVWTCLGLRSELDLLEGGNKNSIILHDCDIDPKIYTRDIVLSLMLPLVHPQIETHFVKAAYQRITTNNKGEEKFAGRVTRLLIAPLIEAMESTYGDIGKTSEFINYLRSFEYILSGEFGMSPNLADIIPIQADWGLEIGTLNFLFDSPFKIGQVQIGKKGVYEHKHTAISHKNPNQGLNKMAIEVSKTLLRKLHSIGGQKILEAERFDKLMMHYVNYGNRLINTYSEISKAKGLQYPELEERRMLQTFEKSINFAFETLKENIMGVRPLPSWHDVNPKHRKELGEIVMNYHQNKE